MKAVAAVLLVASGVATAAPAAIAPKEALSQFFTEQHASFNFNAKKNALELCWDLCEYYVMRRGPSLEVWDTIFLHQYYFVAPGFREQFRERYSAVARDVLAKYKGPCSGSQPEAAARCIVNQLGSRHKVEVAFVRYDEGYRCQVAGRLTDPKFAGKSNCTKVKHAS